MTRWARNLPAMQETQKMRVRSLGQEDALEKGMATLCRSLVWGIPWTEESGRLQAIGLQRVGHNRSNSAQRKGGHFKFPTPFPCCISGGHPEHCCAHSRFDRVPLPSDSRGGVLRCPMFLPESCCPSGKSGSTHVRCTRAFSRQPALLGLLHSSQIRSFP